MVGGGWEVGAERDSNVSLEYVWVTVGVASSDTSSGTDSDGVWLNSSLMTSLLSCVVVGVAKSGVGVVSSSGNFL